ncbi:glycosyl transferase [Vibrio sp. V12_P9A6T4]|uniref:glycosyltransferase n=1 Tax=Vibrio sp. V12_P9A6T4 TaxID=1938667 RepID=UPI000B8E9314|nr:glycosyltransferase [Vibrio sp. V12_P9A6T4]OXX50851.1 glycosyl transferase [Vibrio sp. V12_P9A6T4]
MKKVCVLLAAYNGEKYLKEQLDSILEQKDVEVFLYVSLDLSTDKSLEILQQYSKLKNVNIMEYGKRYGSAGQNFFNLLLKVDFSQYDYVAFADQDDIWLGNKLSNSIELLLSNQASAYSGNVQAFWANGKEALIKKDYDQTSYDYLFESAGPGCTFVMNENLASSIKSVLAKNSSKIADLWLHDWFCYSFARSNGYKWFIGSEPLMLYRQHESNQVGANSGITAILERAKVVLSGDALDKVMIQASFLLQNEKPIALIRENSVWSFFKLLLCSFKCRRRLLDKLMFTLALLLLTIKKLIGI